MAAADIMALNCKSAGGARPSAKKRNELEELTAIADAM